MQLAVYVANQIRILLMDVNAREAAAMRCLWSFFRP